MDSISSKEDFITLTADIAAAHVSNNSVALSEISTLIRNIHSALTNLGEAPAPTAQRPDPAVPVRASVKPDHIVCLEDGRKMKTLKRYLMTRYGMTPDDYRRKWSLSPDYPMVAPNYAEQRRSLAKSIGLGKQPRKRA